MSEKPNRRRGITLLEVLISMGILTIGLVSAVSLLPAGRSMAVKASVYDRSATLAANAAADLINRGLLRSEKWLNYSETETAQTPASRFLMFDPLQQAWDPFSGPNYRVGLRTDAATVAVETNIYTKNPVVDPVCDILFRSEDDPVYSTDGVGNDDPPLPRWSPSNAAPLRRAFVGNYSYLATLESAAQQAPFWTPATPATLTVVVFHRRETGPPFEVMADGNTAAQGWLLPSATNVKDLVRPGNMVLWCNQVSDPTAARWHRVLMATDAGANRAFITCEGSDPLMGAGSVLYLFSASVAAVEMPVWLEGTSEWNR